MHIERRILEELDSPYAVGVFNLGGEKRAVVASEEKDLCLAFSKDGKRLETIWENQGGTMNLCQTDEEGNFLAVQEFYKGFRSHTAGIARAWKEDGRWNVKRYIDLPFVHRFCVQKVEDRQFVIACTLSDRKDSPQDWSRPGRVYLGLLPRDLSEPCEIKELIGGITKNHGLFQGRFQGKAVVLVTGQEGVFRIDVPQKVSDEWHWERIIDREVSDVTAVDIDGDGQDELITIEGFHGNTIALNKLVGGEWKIVSRYPVATAHALWSGDVLGKPGVLVGYRGANAGLLLMRYNGEKKLGNLLLETTVLDQYEGPVNLGVIAEPNDFRIFNVSGTNNRFVYYRLTP
ncbi:MAG: hypothetical protein LBD02_07740 [Christensenellaceae bacterium]|jgi:hypothetical protein|nr:hypothetical protein [Christensenellaceae bacterium]